MHTTIRSKSYLFVTLAVLIHGCAYFNTFYNARQYYEEAEKLRLEKDGESIPITAMDKYGKTITKCKKVIDDFPDSKFVIEAHLLMAKARYYRSDYDLAIIDLNIVQSEGKGKNVEESRYWRALCKWKKGSVRAALDELNELLDNSTSKGIQSKCYLSLAEIAKESNDIDLSISHLQKAAKLTVERDEKGVIYGRLSEMAFNRQDYELAKNGYNNVISHSLSKEKIENAHLQILKILRMQKNYKEAQKKIKSMLVDDKFLRIAGDLELELVQLYRAQGETSEIETRLESIVNDYQRTSVSAEAYYQLGQIYTSEKWDMEKAKEFFEMVSKESGRSLFSPMAKNYVNAIVEYQKTNKDLEIHMQMDRSESEINNDEAIDSTKLFVSQKERPSRTVPELYYQLADLEAFTFNRYDESKVLFDKIINEHPESMFNSKSMFALVFVHYSLKDSTSALKVKNELLNLFPDSDYALYLNDDSTATANEPRGQKKIFMQAESQITHNPSNAIKLFKSTIKLDAKTEYSVSAAYAIGYFYDQEAIIDSALKYYGWLKENHPNTEQSIHANERMNSINFALSTVTPDTTESDIKE